MDRKRDEKGRYEEQIRLDDVLEVLVNSETPVMTARQIAEVLESSGESARQKLERLHEEGRVEKMQVGARAVVWWPSDQSTQ